MNRKERRAAAGKGRKQRPVDADAANLKALEPAFVGTEPSLSEPVRHGLRIAALLVQRLGEVATSPLATGKALFVNVTDASAVLNGPNDANLRPDLQAGRLRGDGWEASMLACDELVSVFRNSGEEDNAQLVERVTARGGLVIVSADSRNNDIYVTRMVSMAKGGSA